MPARKNPVAENHVSSALKKKLKQQIKILEIGVEQLIVFYFTVNEEIVDNRELNEQWNGKKKNRMRGKLMLRCTLYSCYFVFCLYSTWPFQSNSFIFNCTLRKKININCSSWISSFPNPHLL